MLGVDQRLDRYREIPGRGQREVPVYGGLWAASGEGFGVGAKWAFGALDRNWKKS